MINDRVGFFRNSFTGRSVGTVPTRESDFGAIRSPVEVPMSQKRGKKELLGLFAPLRSAPRPPILAQIWIFFPKTWGIISGFTPFMNWADIWPLRRSRPNLVRLVGNSDERREPRWDAPSRFGP